MRTALLAIALAAAPVTLKAQDTVQYAAAKDLAAKVATTTNGLVTAPIPAGPGVTVIIARRDRTGEVEVHARFADHFVVRSGTAVVIVGGRVEGDRETAPGERRGGQIVGGARYPVGPGDLLWIPAGQPHQVTMPAGGSFTYLVTKHETKPAS